MDGFCDAVYCNSGLLCVCLDGDLGRLFGGLGCFVGVGSIVVIDIKSVFLPPCYPLFVQRKKNKRENT